MKERKKENNSAIMIEMFYLFGAPMCSDWAVTQFPTKY